MSAQPVPPPAAPPKQGTPSSDLLPARLYRRRHAALHAWQSLCVWVQSTTRVPKWLPDRWRRPLTGYLLALVLGIVACGVTQLLGALTPTFNLEGVLPLVGIGLVALTFGVGPSLIATAVGFLLLADVIMPGSIVWRQDPTGGVDLVVFLLSGLGLSFLAGQSSRARRKAEALADSLRAAKESSDVERRRLRTLLEVLPVPVAMVDSQGQFLEQTPAHQTIWGKRASLVRDLADVPLYPAWRPDSGQPATRAELPIVRALTTGESILNEELEFEAVDGQRIILLSSAAPIRDGTGAVHGAVGIAQDITQHKRLEQEAAEHAAQLETIFESIADGVVVTDREGRIRHMNQAYRRLLGLEQDPRGWTFSELTELTGFVSTTDMEEPLGEGVAPVRRVLQGEVLTRQQSMDTILRTRTGRDTMLNSTGAPIWSETGEQIGAVLVARDVTQQRRLEQQTRDALDALLAMAEAIVQGHDEVEQAVHSLEQGARPEADPALASVAARLAELTRRVLDCRSVSIVAVDAQTEVLTPITLVGHSLEDEQRWWANWTGEEQLHLGDGLPSEAEAALRGGEPVLPEHLPAPFLSWLQQHSQVRPAVLVPMRVGETLVGVLQIEGEERRAPGEASGTEQKGALVQAVARLGALVLERERLLRERTQAQATELALRATQAQMEAFLATAAHDLRSPLAAVVGYLDLAQSQTERLADDVQQACPELAPRVEAVARRLHAAEEGTDRLTRLLNLLFDRAAMRAGKLQLHRAPCDLAALVREQVEALRVAAPERTLRLYLPADGVLVTVEADADRVGQVVTNFVTNALKYSLTDQLVDVTVEASENLARVMVRDQGPGLPETERARVWEPFHRVAGVEVQGMARGGAGGGSLGLGLHICKAVIQAHGGQVGVESAVGEGSTFWFTLPLAGAPLASPIAA